MNNRSFLIVIATCIVCTVALSGCGKFGPKLDEVLPDKRTAYKKSKSLPDLEVPPDLTTDAIRDQMAIPQGGETATYSTFQEREAQRKKEQELARTQESAIQVLENEHVLAVQGASVQIWPELRRFWLDLGYELELDDDELGVVETQWEENQEELIRNKFKVFAEPGQEQGTTVLYVSHRGEELVPQGENLVWQPRARDVELERRIVERLQAHLGGVSAGDSFASSESTPPAQDATVAPDLEQRAEIVSAGSGKIYLSLQEEFSSAWDSTQIALSRAGIEVEEADKTRGVYSIRMAGSEQGKKKGMWSKLKFWGGDSSLYQLSLTGVGEKTELVLLDEDGEWETSESGTNLLRQVQSELNRGS